jgi:hypothetical protein
MLFMFTILFQAPSAKAADALAFFRSPDSLFASGQAPLAELEKKQTRTESVSFFKIKKDGRELRVTPENLVRDLDLSLRIAQATRNPCGAG